MATHFYGGAVCAILVDGAVSSDTLMAPIPLKPSLLLKRTSNISPQGNHNTLQVICQWPSPWLTAPTTHYLQLPHHQPLPMVSPGSFPPFGNHSSTPDSLRLTNEQEHLVFAFPYLRYFIQCPVCGVYHVATHHRTSWFSMAESHSVVNVELLTTDQPWDWLHMSAAVTGALVPGQMCVWHTAFISCVFISRSRNAEPHVPFTFSFFRKISHCFAKRPHWFLLLPACHRVSLSLHPR